MAKNEDLAKTYLMGASHQKMGVLLRGYKKSERAGAFTARRIRSLAAYLIQLADEADEYNNQEK